MGSMTCVSSQCCDGQVIARHNEMLINQSRNSNLTPRRQRSNSRDHADIAIQLQASLPFDRAIDDDLLEAIKNNHDNRGYRRTL